MKKNNIFPLLVIGTLAAMLVLSVGITQARFRENLKETVPFRPEEAETLVLQEKTAWETVGNTSTLSFAVENTGDVRENGRVYMLASQGIQSGEKLTVTLTQAQQVYTAAAEPIPEGSTLYKSFGEGWIYRFFDGQGQELIWPVEANGQLTYQLSVKSNASIGYDSLIRVIAEKVTQ